MKGRVVTHRESNDMDDMTCQENRDRDKQRQKELASQMLSQL